MNDFELEFFTNAFKWLKVEGSANSIHIEKKLYYALATKTRSQGLMAHLIYLICEAEVESPICEAVRGRSVRP